MVNDPIIKLQERIIELESDVLLHSILRVELTNALQLNYLKPRTRQGNSDLAGLVDDHLKRAAAQPNSNSTTHKH